MFHFFHVFKIVSIVLVNVISVHVLITIILSFLLETGNVFE